jgi:6-phosphofructokinase 1
MCEHVTIRPCRSENASNVYSLDVITKMFKEEGGTLFDARSASLGHTLQGGIPSPTDRARAVRLSLRCIAFLERYHETLSKQPFKRRTAPPDSAAVITIQGSKIKWIMATEMVEHADMKKRVAKYSTSWWAGMKTLVEALVGREEFVQLGSNGIE